MTSKEHADHCQGLRGGLADSEAAIIADFKKAEDELQAESTKAITVVAGLIAERNELTTRLAERSHDMENLVDKLARCEFERDEWKGMASRGATTNVEYMALMEKADDERDMIQTREEEARWIIENAMDGRMLHDWVPRRDAWLAGAAFVAIPDYSGNEEPVIGRASFDKPAPTQTEKELALLRVTGDIKTEQWEKAQARAEKAEAEVRRLREALEEIAKDNGGSTAILRSIARAALIDAALRGGEK